MSFDWYIILLDFFWKKKCQKNADVKWHDKLCLSIFWILIASRIIVVQNVTLLSPNEVYFHNLSHYLTVSNVMIVHMFYNNGIEKDV